MIEVEVQNETYQSQERIRFPEMEEVVEGALNAVSPAPLTRVQDVLSADREARAAASEVVERLSRVETRRRS